jgi:hypothetical protein
MFHLVSLHHAPFVLRFYTDLTMIIVPSMFLHAIVQLFEQLFASFFFSRYVLLSDDLLTSEEVGHLLSQVDVADRHFIISTYHD